MNQVLAISLVVLRSADVERARAFYEALGLRLTEEQHGDGPRHYSATLGTVVLEIYPQTNLDTRGLRLGLVVRELSASVQAAVREGGRLVRIDEGAQPATATVTDLDGHRIELTQATRSR